MEDEILRRRTEERSSACSVPLKALALRSSRTSTLNPKALPETEPAGRKVQLCFFFSVKGHEWGIPALSR